VNRTLSAVSAVAGTLAATFGACGGGRKTVPDATAVVATAAVVPAAAAEPTAVTLAAAAVTPATAAALDGDAIISVKCTVCHTRARINRKKAADTDRATWELIVAQMIKNGAEISEAEKEAVLDYLAP
jgi:cytochrome c5